MEQEWKDQENQKINHLVIDFVLAGWAWIYYLFFCMSWA